ncbi:hypothetical protein [Streptomyces sp. AK02-01A]|uniref:hypothetical protein n=1 Tax=Streptomyces sp. AK02-01A TaxID=3028648 RepID=UPI0029BBEEB5|nr:hypothetical protein [Streptomyces sp. AK02-01A]MDX3855656.1 hypothetical protein [Streptomyces sp. AK02-01A]
MTDPNPYAVRLADEIARLIDLLGDHLTQATSRQAAQILTKVLDSEKGILGRLTTLVATGSQQAKHHTEAGTFPPEVWLALGRAANALDDVCLDLDEHADDVRRLAQAATPAHAVPANRFSCAGGPRR